LGPVDDLRGCRIDVDGCARPCAAACLSLKKRENRTFWLPQTSVELAFLQDAIAMSSLQISTDRTELDVPLIYRFLSEQSTWAIGISRAIVDRAIENSLCFGGYVDGRQVAFARVVTDFATFGNLVDMFVIPEYRGRGYASELMEVVMAHPSLKGLRRFTLATGNAHGLYEKFGFAPPQLPDTLMERYFPNIYLS
jgi:GNAT superfamily N-acetyltransferase